MNSEIILCLIVLFIISLNLCNDSTNKFWAAKIQNRFAIVCSFDVSACQTIEYTSFRRTNTMKET